MRMSRSASSLFAPGPLALAAMIALAALSRLLPHPPNFSPVEAMALFGGAHFASKRLALLVPLAAMLLSDALLGLLRGGLYLNYFASAGFWLTYLCIALIAGLGMAMRGRVSSARVLAYGLVGATVFFLVSNFGAWLGDPMYPKTAAGLGAAYVAGIPFFKWSVAGTMAYGALLFGGFALLRRQLPALRPQTV